MNPVFIILWLAAIAAAQHIGRPKHRAGWAWGLGLGWIGVVIVSCLSDKNNATFALTAKQHEIAELEADLKLAELRQRLAVSLVPERVADVDREHVIRQLRGHMLAGRLTAVEFEERLGSAHASRTRADLGGLTTDLPVSPAVQ